MQIWMSDHGDLEPCHSLSEVCRQPRAQTQSSYVQTGDGVATVIGIYTYNYDRSAGYNLQSLSSKRVCTLWFF